MWSFIGSLGRFLGRSHSLSIAQGQMWLMSASCFRLGSSFKQESSGSFQSYFLCLLLNVILNLGKQFPLFCRSSPVINLNQEIEFESKIQLFLT